MNNVNPKPKESSTNSSKVNKKASTSSIKINQKSKASSQLASEKNPASEKEASDIQNKKNSPFRTASIKPTSAPKKGTEKNVTKEGNENEDLAKNLSDTLGMSSNTFYNLSLIIDTFFENGYFF